MGFIIQLERFRFNSRGFIIPPEGLRYPSREFKISGFEISLYGYRYLERLRYPFWKFMILLERFRYASRCIIITMEGFRYLSIKEVYWKDSNIQILLGV